MQQEELIAEAKEFFESYKREIGRSAKEGKKSISVSFQDLAANSHQLSEELLQRPEEILQLLELALDESGLITNVKVRLTELPSTQEVKTLCCT